MEKFSEKLILEDGEMFNISKEELAVIIMEAPSNASVTLLVQDQEGRMISTKVDVCDTIGASVYKYPVLYH